MNGAGQATIEIVILLALIVALALPLAKAIPTTLKMATPYLSGQIESRLQTGTGFASTPGTTTWTKPISPKGGVHD